MLRLWLAYASGSPTYTRISTEDYRGPRYAFALACLPTASPALSLASHLGHNPKSVLSCGESRRSGSETAATAAAPAPVVPISTLCAGLPKPHSARRARIHPSRAAGLGCAIAPADYTVLHTRVAYNLFLLSRV